MKRENFNKVYAGSIEKEICPSSFYVSISSGSVCDSSLLRVNLIIKTENIKKHPNEGCKKGVILDVFYFMQ